MEGIHNNNYMIGVSDTNCLVNTTPNGKQFGFSSCNVDCFVNCLDDRSVIWMNVQDWHSYMVLNTGVRYDNGRRRVWWCSKYNIIQVFDVLFDIQRMWMERKLIWKESIRQLPRLNSLSLKTEKEGKSLLQLLSISMSVDFKQSFCLGVRLSMEILWELCLCNPSELRMLLIMWLGGSDDPLRRNLPYSFLK